MLLRQQLQTKKEPPSLGAPLEQKVQLCPSTRHCLRLKTSAAGTGHCGIVWISLFSFVCIYVRHRIQILIWMSASNSTVPLLVCLVIHFLWNSLFNDWCERVHGIHQKNLYGEHATLISFGILNQSHIRSYRNCVTLSQYNTFFQKPFQTSTDQILRYLNQKARSWSSQNILYVDASHACLKYSKNCLRSRIYPVSLFLHLRCRMFLQKVSRHLQALKELPHKKIFSAALSRTARPFCNWRHGHLSDTTFCFL